MARILIVDDDPDVVDACRVTLESDGHQVTFAYSRDEGMRAIAAAPPELLVLDVIMEQPDDGIAMAQELRRLGFASPILMLTSIGRISGLAYGRDETMLPVDDFVDKPIKPAALLERVRALIAAGEATPCS